MPNKNKKNKKNSPAVFEDGHLVRRDLSDDDASSLNGAVPTPAPIPKKSKKRKPVASPHQSSEEDAPVDQASSSEYEDSEASHHSSPSGEGDCSVASRSSRSSSPAASALHESADCTPEQLHEDHRRSYQVKLNSYLDEMFSIAQQRSQLPQTLGNFQKLVELAERHRQLTILADALSSILSFMRGSSPSFNSDRNVSPCHPRPRGQWQPRGHSGANWSSASSRSRSPSSASSHSVLSWASEPDTITSSPQTNVFSSSLTKERTITSSSQERTSTPPSGKREENDQWITVPSRKSKRRETPSTRSSGKRREKFSTRSSDKRKEKRSTLPSNQRKEKNSTPPSNQRREKSSTSPSNQRREKSSTSPSNQRREKKEHSPSPVPQRRKARGNATAAVADVQPQQKIIIPSGTTQHRMHPSPPLSSTEGDLSEDLHSLHLNSSSTPREEKHEKKSQAVDPLPSVHQGPTTMTNPRRNYNVPVLKRSEQWRGDSDKRPISEFISLLQARMIACGTAEEDKWRALASSTQDAAFLDWVQLNIFDLDPKPDWQTCKSLLIQEFGNTRESNQARTDFLNLRQPEGVGHGAKTLREAARLLAKCGDKQGDWTQQYVVYFVIGSMLNQRYKEKLQCNFQDPWKFNWKTLSLEVHKLDDLFRGDEAYSGRRRGNNSSEASSSSHSRPNKVNERARGPDRKPGKRERRDSPARSSSSRQPYRSADRSSASSSSYYQSSRPTGSARREVVCYKCGKPGHISSRCGSGAQTPEQREVQTHIRRLQLEQEEHVSLDQVRDLQAQQRNGELPYLSPDERAKLRRVQKKKRR